MKWNINFKKSTTNTQPKKSVLREWGDALLFALIASTLVRGLLFSAYAIPSGSMEGTQFAGDYLFVSKISYGPRMAITPLAIPFTEPKVGGIKTYWDGIQLPYFRLPGLSTIKKQDIVVFNKPEEADLGLPIDERTTLIKRCQGAPGDVLSIINSQVYINGVPVKNAPKIQTSYTVITNGVDINPQILHDFNITVQMQNDANTYEMTIPTDHLAELKTYSNIKSITPVIAPAGVYDPAIFPHNEQLKWNVDNYGPIKLPKKGWTVELSDSTLALYRRAIEIYENNKVAVNGKDILINGKKADSYTFKMDYYWMMGDNRHDSMIRAFGATCPKIILLVKQ